MHPLQFACKARISVELKIVIIIIITMIMITVTCIAQYLTDTDGHTKLYKNRKTVYIKPQK